MTRFDRLFVWTGGALFVTALAGCVWWYLIPLGQARPAGGGTSIAWDLALVTLFALHHSLFARDAIKRRLASIPAGLRRSFYVWVASLLLIAVCTLWQPVGGQLYDAGGVL